MQGCSGTVPEEVEPILEGKAVLWENVYRRIYGLSNKRQDSSFFSS